MKLQGLLPVAALCAGCPSTPKEVPPPAESYTIASAAPGALGAFAAGTKAAPQAVTPRGTPTFNPGDEDQGSPEDEDGGVAGPDGGTNGSEDLPL
jgi:hypothetical protein